MFDKFLNFAKSGLPKTGESEHTDFSFLKNDIHAHILPGIDDGPKTVEESIVLIQELKRLGFEGIVTTPHIRSDQYPNNHETINKALSIVNEALSKAKISVPIKAAAEYYLDEEFIELLENEPLLTINRNQVLVECSLLFEPPKLYDTIDKIVSKGYVPIIAHAERYFFYHKDIEKYKMLKEKGCLLQLNLISLTGYYNRQIKSIADSILKNNLYDYCASNVHHTKHIDVMKKVLKSGYMKTLSNYPFVNSEVTF